MARAEVQLALDASLFRRGIANAEAALQRFGGAARRIGGLATGALGSVGIALSGAAFARGVKNVLELGSSLHEMRQQTGISVRDLVLLREAFRDAGLGAEDVATAVNKMQKSIMAGGRGFEDLGLQTKRLLKLGPAEQFDQIGKAIAAIENPMKRAAIAMEIFGKSGAQLLPFFMGGLGGASQQVNAQAEAMERNAEAFDRVADKMKNARLAAEGFFIGVAENMLPKIEAVLDRMDQVNWMQKGKDFAAGIEGAVAMIGKIKGFFDRIDETMNKYIPFGALRGGGGVVDAAKTALALAGVRTTPEAPFGGMRAPALPAPLAHLSEKPLSGRPGSTGFWDRPDPRLQFGANTGKLQNFVSKVNPFMSQSEAEQIRQNEFFKRFPDARRDQAFTDKFGPGTTDNLEKWSEKMGVKRGAYNQIRRGDAERRKAAEAPKDDKIKATIDEQSMKTFADKVATAIEKKVP